MASIKEAIEGGEKLEQTAPEPTINPDFQALLDIQTEESLKELKTMLEKEGVRDPIVVWKEKNQIADGHTRYQIGKELKINVPIVYKSFKDEEEVKQWIIRNQLARRNLTPARFTYFIGKLYNEQKVTAMTGGGKAPAKGKGSTADNIAKEFDVTPTAVRTAAKQAAGIDLLEKARGKMAKAKQLSNKPEYTGEEMAAVGTIAQNTTQAAKALDKIDSYKEEQKKKKVQAKKVAETVKARGIDYNVILVQPDFEIANAVGSVAKPTMGKECIAYVIVPDEYLPMGLQLLERWGLSYEASFVFYGTKTMYDAAYTKVCHTFVLLGTKGHVIGPKAGTELSSTQVARGEIGPQVMALINQYHNGNVRKLDMRRDAKEVQGWDNLTKAQGK